MLFAVQESPLLNCHGPEPRQNFPAYKLWQLRLMRSLRPPTALYRLIWVGEQDENFTGRLSAFHYTRCPCLGRNQQDLWCKFRLMVRVTLPFLLAIQVVA